MIGVTMGLFARKCGYCQTKIEKGKEIRRGVNASGHKEIYQKNFCCGGHADAYEHEIEKHIKRTRKSRGGCCGG